MTENTTYVSRRERRRAGRGLAHAVAHNAGTAGRTTAAVLASAGLVVGTGVAANATDDSAEGREATTLEVNTSELNVERASAQAAVAVTASTEVEVSFDRPVVSSEAAPEPEPEPEPAPEPVVEAAPVSQDTTVEQASAESQPSQPQEQSQQSQEQSQQEQSQSSSSSQQGSSSESDSSSTASSESSSEQQPSSGGRGGVVSAAYSTLGTPHVMGGTTPGVGIDCSGMIQYAYAQAGISVPRTTHGIAASVPRVSSPQPGDIVLSNGNSHGGIYVGNGQVISTTASGGVRVHGLHDGWHNVTSYHRPG